MNSAMYCSICHFEFDKSQRLPKILHCGHTFCYACLQILEQPQGIVCPHDRLVDQRPAKDIATNYILNQVISPRMQGVCNQHKEHLKLFCFDDQEAICLICAQYGDHSSHKVGDINNALSALKQKFMNIKELIKTRQDEIRQTLEIQREETDGLSTKLSNYKQKISKITQNLIEELQKNLQEKIQQADEKAEQIFKISQESISKLQQTLQELEDIDQYGQDTEEISKLIELNSKAETLLNVKTQRNALVKLEEQIDTDRVRWDIKRMFHFTEQKASKVLARGMSQQNIMSHVLAAKAGSKYIFTFNIISYKMSLTKSKAPQNFPELHSAIQLNDESLLLTGGRRNGITLNEVWQVDKYGNFNKWPNMLTPHDCHKVARTNEEIFVISGHNRGTDKTTVCEKFSVDSKK